MVDFANAGRVAASSIALAVLAACAGNPTSHDPGAAIGALPLLAASRSAAQVPDLAIDRWWTLFGDAALEALIEESLTHNHDLAAAAARVRQARAQLDEVDGARLPALDLQAQTGRSQQSGDGALPPGAPRTSSNHRVSLAAHYDIDLWGRLAAGSEAARQRLLAQEWARASLQWSLTVQIAEAHFGLRAVQRQIEISEAVRASRVRSVDLRRREHAAGAAGEFELRRAEAELAVTDVTATNLQRQRVALERAVALLSGRPLNGIVDREASREALTTSPPFDARLPQGDATQLLLQRPDLRRAEARLAASRADISAARAVTLPALRLSGSLGSDVRSLSNLFNGPGFVWSIALAATQSVFDGGRARARVQQADAAADAALAEYRQAVLTAVTDLREAYAALDLAQAAHAAGHERVVALERARRLAQLGFAHGALAQIDVLDAERNSYQAQLDEVGAARDRRLGQVAAFKALGGGQAAPRVAHQHNNPGAQP